MSGDISRQLRKPTTHKGRKFLEKREPRIFENDKHTLLIKGGHTSQIVNDFLTDMFLLKKPLVNKLRWKNSVFPFQDASFIEHMCNKLDCSLFILAMHSKKRPNNVVIGRLHDNEILDMYELGIENYKTMRSSNVKFSLGSKPLLAFSGESFDDTDDMQRFKSILIDIFKGPTVSRINSSGLEHVMHFIMPSEEKLILRVNGIKLKYIGKEELKSASIDSDYFTGNSPSDNSETLVAPWGPYVKIELENAAPEIDFVLRRRLMPSEDKWKRACRVPAEQRPRAGKQKNRSMDVFGSKVGQVHLAREHALDELRPGTSIRTALTGNVKRGFERRSEAVAVSDGKKRKRVNSTSPTSKSKRRRET